jgi:hypothetical protein
MSGDLLSPIDGRYARYTAALRSYLSEAAFFRYRILVETAYLEALIELPLPPLKDFPSALLPRLYEAYENFSEADLARLRTLEAQTRHDVKAIEYFLREKWEPLLPSEHKYLLAFIHFGLTLPRCQYPRASPHVARCLTKGLPPCREGAFAKAPSPILHLSSYAHVRFHAWAAGFPYDFRGRSCMFLSLAPRLK